MMPPLRQPSLQSLLMGWSTEALNETPPKSDIKGYPYEEVFSPVAQPIPLPEHARKCTLSPTYSPQIKTKYIEQCFDDVKYLAEGSFGIVFEARSKDDGKRYAVKQFKKPFANQKQRSAKLMEIHRYARIPRSRFCVELIRAWEENAFLYVQMEFCSVTLKQHIARQGISDKLLWRIFLDLLLAVKHLHENEFIHLDIKPDNILVARNNTFKLADFGLMQDLSQGTVSDAEEGDARYLAPEILRGQFTEFADIFSLGISMLEVGSNIQLPSHGSLWQELRSGVLPYCRFACTSKELFAIICEMMAPVATDRPSAIDLLKNERLVKMYQRRRFFLFFDDVGTTMRSICNYTKVVAVRCGTKIIAPFVSSRACPRACKRKAGRGAECEEQFDQMIQPDLPSIGQERREPPPLKRPVASRTKEEERLFLARLSACKKRLTFEEEEEEPDPNPVTSSVPNPLERNADEEGPDESRRQQISSKRRRLFD